MSTAILLFFCVSAVQTNSVSAAGNPKPINDGFFLAGVEGALITEDRNEPFSFRLNADINEPGVFAGAGTCIELLPCSTLEKIAADANEFPDSNYRIWGTVTKYRGKNFIFAAYFLPLDRPQKTPAETEQKLTDSEQAPPINDPNDTVTIPEHILSRLRTRKTIQPAPASKTEFTRDYILADRTGFITTLAGDTAVFTFDALGRNAETQTIELLGSQALELAQNKQAHSLEALRFKVAGIITQFKNRRYMLLQRAARVYSHGNFPG